MAIVATEQLTKARLVYQVDDGEGGTKQTSRTFSNFIANVSDDALYAGLSAIAGLMDVTGAGVVRVDESQLVSE